MKLFFAIVASVIIGLTTAQPAHAMVAAAATPDTPCGDYSTSTRILAKRLLNCSRVTWRKDNQVDARALFKQIETTGAQKACGKKIYISANLLKTLLAMTKKYTVKIGVLAAGHACDGKLHTKGKAADINGVAGYVNGKRVHTGARIDGSGTYSFTESADAKRLLKNFYVDLGKELKAINRHGGLGQSQCFRGSLASGLKVSGITYFGGDSCNHIHLDVR